MDYLTELAVAFIAYLPYYIGMVLVPAVLRVIVERVLLGIRHEEVFMKIELPLLRRLGVPRVRVETNASFEEVFSEFVSVGLFWPLFEELVFRGLPYLFWRLPGLVIGDIVWVLMHPAWQLQYLEGYPLKTRLGFLATTTMFYASSAAFYSMLWLNGYGILALVYHVFHNAVLVASDALKSIEVRLERRSEEQSGIDRQLPVSFVRSTRSLSEYGEYVFIREREE